MAGRRLRRSSHGAALLIFLVLLVLGTLTYIVNSFSPEAVETLRLKRTGNALAEAQAALIGYALKYRDEELNQGINLDRMYGYLPLPDLGSTRNNNATCTTEGCDANTPTGISCDSNKIYPTIVGRFPWRTIGVGPLRDGSGECLWLMVSSLHLRKQCTNPTLPPMNWDTLGQLDVITANGTATLSSILATPHDRPVAIIFAPGPPLPGQDRSPAGADDVRQCGGNYNAANYLDPVIASALGGATNYLAGTNASSGATGDSDITNDPDDTQKKSVLPLGKLFNSGGNYIPSGCSSGDCNLLANDIGLPITSDALFANLRKHKNFRADLNSMLDRMVGCLRDQRASGSALTLDANSTGLQATPNDKVAGRIPNQSCYDDTQHPRGYFSHYKEMVFVAQPNSGNFTINGESCSAALLFSSQRNTAWNSAGEPTGNIPHCPPANVANSFQCRSSQSERNLPANYLEGINLTSFTLPSAITVCPVGSDCISFSGPVVFDRISDLQSASQDIVRCIPASGSSTIPSLVIRDSSGLTAASLSQLASYSAASRSLTLGQANASSYASGLASDLYGCAWVPETHPMGDGLRSYFSFRINDAGFSSSAHEGFTFAVVDGDNNSTSACGAARQHLGYSGNNTKTPYIAPPKIGFEVDPRLESGFNPGASSTLSNGRNDPSYTGGHVGIVYWGGETSIATGGSAPCTAPRITVGTSCYLPPEEDDNVHGQAANTRSGFPVPPVNPVAPATPTLGSGAYKLDPSLSSVPVNQDIHVRIEVTRATSSYSLPQARVATTADLNLAAPGAAIDGVTLFSKDRVLVKNQTFPSDNGIYVWNGTSNPMTRATDADTAIKLSGSLIEILQGTLNARTIWRQTGTNLVLGTDDVKWANANVKLAMSSNVSLSSPGASLDNILLSSGDRILLKGQTIPSENGIYVWNGATSAMTRPLDAGTAGQLTGIVVQVRQGSEATAWWRYNGSNWYRLSVRLAAQTAINLNSPGATIDGLALASGDRVLLKSQANAADNGIYVWNGATSAMTRAADADTAAKLEGALTQVIDGTDSGRAFHQTSLAASGTLGSTAIQWSAIDPAPNFTIEAWILPDSVTVSNQIAAMKNTTRPMSLLYPSFSAHLRSTATIGYPFRNVRLGFTTGQRTSITDQTFSIKDFFTTWLN